MDTQNFQNKIEKYFLSKKSSKSKILHWDTQFPESSKYKRIGLRVPETRQFLKEFLSLSEIDLEMSQTKKNKLWNHLWKNSYYYEVMSSAIYSFQYRQLSETEFKMIAGWTKRITCWEHSDDLSKIYAQCLEENRQLVLPYLKRWNKSKNSWERRQSVVSLLEYSSKRTKTLSFKELVSFISPLLKDEEYYVQKGIGWTLREIYNLFPKETLGFIESNLGEIHPNAYSAAVEKLSPAKKKELREKRKNLRKS